MRTHTDANQLQINALVADAQAQADAASQLWAEVYASRLQQNLGALKANLTQAIASSNISGAQQISQAISGAYALAAAEGGVQMEVIDLPSVSVKSLPRLQTVNVQALLPSGGGSVVNDANSTHLQTVDPDQVPLPISSKEREVLAAISSGEDQASAAERIFAGKSDPSGAWHSTVGRLKSKKLL